MPSLHVSSKSLAHPSSVSTVRRQSGLSDSTARRIHLRPVAHAVALLLASGVMAEVHAQQAFSSAWYGAKSAVQANAAATGRLPNGQPVSSLNSPLMQQQQAAAQLQRSLGNLGVAVQTLAAAQAAQAAARQAALAAGSNVPNGLGSGGLVVDTNSLTKGWNNANGPVQTVADGKTTVTIQQTADKAILNWETFNVGMNTTVNFQQQSSWSVLNRVNDPLARPSQIQGQITGDGNIMIVNRNGIVFSGSSQIDTRSLVAAAATITDTQFRDKGLYVDAVGSLPTFTDALGKVDVQAGAQIATRAATSATQGGGYVLLLGQEVSNAGQISTANGQTTLAAGDSFYIRKGVSTDGNATSTTRGNEVSSSGNGKVRNSGVIAASTGDITLTGHTVEQAGVLLSTTSAGTRGTIHLLNRAGDATGTVTLGENSVTAIVLDSSPATALDSQRDAALKNLDGVKTVNNITANFDNLSSISDRTDLSRIEIVSGNTVEFKQGSLTLATGGQIAVAAKQRTLVGNGAELDVSGAIGVQISMASNNLKINVQGNELRDAAGNRDGQKLSNNDVWIDKRDLILVPAGTNGYATDRWYTAGGLLEVSGYIATGGHSTGEWMAQGGTVTFAGKDVVTQSGSNINLSGGTIDVATGYMNRSWLKGTDGNLYNVSTAPGDLLYTGVYKGFESTHDRWGKNTTEYYYNPLITPNRTLENGYTVGRDAGRLIVATESAVLEGKLIGEVYQGPAQTQAPKIDLDGYYQSQKASARGAQLIIGQYQPRYDATTGILRSNLAAAANQVLLTDTVTAIADGLDLSSALPVNRQGTVILDTSRLNGFNLGALTIAAKDSITADSKMQVGNGGSITLYGPQINVNANLVAHGGSIAAGNVLKQMSGNNRYEDTTQVAAAGKPTGVNVASGVTLDTSGLWSNLSSNPDNTSGMPYLNGGTVTLRSTADIALAAGSAIDVSSGAAILSNGKQSGGKGGNVTLEASANSTTGKLVLAGDLKGYGVNGGGTLNVLANRVVIGNAINPTPETLVLDAGFFNKGFSQYQVTGSQGVTVSDGTQVDVSMPVYRFGDNAGSSITGSNAKDALELWTPSVYLEDALKGVLTQRKGASLSLQAGTLTSSAADMASVQAVVGKGAVINVDPGQNISISSIGQLTVDGRLNAWGGKITLGAVSVSPTVAEAVDAAGHGRSIWIGEQAVLDVAARAVTAVALNGTRYGQVRNGGSIVVGGEINHATGIATAPNLFVVVREGALLDASGAQATLDIAGLGATRLASSGGSISLASNNGLYLDGLFKANAGGAGAAGGTLNVALETPLYPAGAATRVRAGRELVLSQGKPASALSAGSDAANVAGSLLYGHAELGTDQIVAGGFDNLSLLSNGVISVDGNLSLRMGQSLNLYANALALSNAAAADTRVLLAAPYVRLSGVGAIGGADGKIRPTALSSVSTQMATGQLQVEAGAVLDLRDNLSIGVHSDNATAPGLASLIDRRAFDRVALRSQGDMRLLGSTVNGKSTVFSSSADVSLAAAQIYPTTGAIATIRAGYIGGNVNYDASRKLVIERTTQSDQAQPYSVFGSLTLAAAVIEQGGLLRAPMGSITLGTNGTQSTSAVHLLPGSVTTVSAAGLHLPYGGTVDGVSWLYDGKAVELLGAGGMSSNGNLKVGVTLAGQLVDVQAGALLDLSGGGQLLGAAFVSGRGGSVDARYNPLLQIGSNGGFIMPGLGSNPVYAIVPGVQSVATPGGGASDPLLGQQITIGAGVPGLAAGTYTLLPSTYALLPGAFRVELNGATGAGGFAAAQAMRNGSWSTSGQLSIAGTGIRDVLARQFIVTAADTLRTYSQYNETSYADFVRADALRIGVPRAALEADAKTLVLHLSAGGTNGIDFNFNGQARFQAGAGGLNGTLALVKYVGGDIEILAPGVAAGSKSSMISVYANDLNAVGASRLTIGSLPWVRYGQGGNHVVFDYWNGADSVFLRQGATLAAAEVFLVSSMPTGGIEIEAGASINTLGRGKAVYDAGDGFIYQPENHSVVAVSNGRVQMLAPTPGTTPSAGPGQILVGQCSSGVCAGNTTLYSEGSIVFATTNTFALSDTVRYGTRHLGLAVGGINVGSDAMLAAAAANNILPSGLTLNQDVLNRLLHGDVGSGIPALETLSLTAGASFNFYGDTTLSTLDASGKSLLANLVLSTPAIYGYGAAGDVARIQTGNLIWNGAATAPGAVVANGAGTGTGTLEIQAQRIEFGYGPDTQPDTIKSSDRLALGFANVNLHASERITANHKGSLAVYQSQGAYDAVNGFAYSGGNLNITTPLMTGGAGSVNRITAGGAINISGAAATTPAPGIDALGAELSLSGNSIVLDTSVVLPSGKLTLSARQDLTLTDAARIDMAGRKLMFNDVSKYSWGGDVTLESHTGNIRQASGSVIDLSAQHNQAGHLKAVAVDAAAGLVDLQGQILGGSSGYYNAGGTLVPYTAGVVDIRAQTMGDFAAFNQRLNAGQVFGGRSFQLKQGDLVIGNEVKAGVVDISIDNGTLTVNGTIDASGERVGSIRLAGKHGLTIAGTALLDTHGTKLRVDSYGKIIDSPNRAMVELNSGDGLLTLASGARIDLRHGTEVAAGNRPGQHDGQQRGTLELNAPRIGSDGLPTDVARGTGSDAAIRGDIAIDASGQLDIAGARSIVVNATQRYDDAPVAVVKDASGNVVLGPDGKPVLDLGAGGRSYQVIDQDYLNQKHVQSTDFMTAALGNAGLMNGKLAGLNTARYADAFHLRPGVEIVTTGDLVISGDLDLSAYRYAGVNPHAQKTGVYGSGEPGNLVIRAGRNLDIYGSINDGFAPPPPTPDDNGWVLTPGRQAYGGDVVVPGPGVVLADGTLFPDGKTLNYALPIQATTVAGGTVLPVQAELKAALTLPANTVLRAAVRDQAGTVVYAAGTILGAAVTLNAGMRLDAGTLLPQAASLAALTWPAGVPLPSRASFDNYSDPNGVRLAGPLALKIGALIPSETDVKLPDGALSVPLRTVTGGIQGRNWAVAPMLAEGSLSWSLRLVSGADTQAANTRAIKPVLLGDLTLADTHYALYETHDKTIIPGTPARPGGLLYWDELGALFGFVPGTLVAPGDEINCGDEGVCIRVNYVWGEFAFLYNDKWLEGTPVAAADEKDCDPDICTPIGKAIPGTPDQVTIGKVNKVSPITAHFSVLRTGTGDMDLVAAGNLRLQSPYGVYTAGTSTSSLAAAQAAGFNQARSRSSDGVTVLGSGGAAYENIVNAGGSYAAWYPDHGGNLLLRAGGSVTGDIFGQLRAPADQNARMQKPNSEVGNWLWRQGTGNTAGVDNIPTSWWINFGTYVKEAGSTNSGYADKDIIDKLPMLIGFTGFGTLGGGNLTLDAGSDAGMLSRRGTSVLMTSPRSQGLLLTVGSTGRVSAGGDLLLTGGGDLDVRVGGSVNPGLSARAMPYVASAETAKYDVQDLSLNGVVSNLRGAVNVQTGSLGGIALNYGSRSGSNDVRESRAFNPFNATLGTATGGMVLMLGDAAASLSVRGDLVLAGSGDPGRVYQQNSSAYQYQGTRYDSGGYGWFSLWTDNTAINLFAAGGNLTPSVQMSDMTTVRNFSRTDGRFLLPSQLHTVAANGSIYLGNSALGERGANNIAYSILLAPGSNGSLEMLAGNSIYAGGYAVNQSGAGREVTPTPLTPAFMGMKSDARSEMQVSNLGIDAIRPVTNSFSLFAFGAETLASHSRVGRDPARIYAINGDIVGVRSGELLSFSSGPRIGQTWYEAAGPVWMMAGRDIVNSGTALGQATIVPPELVATPAAPVGGAATSRGNLFIHHNPEDVSVVSAGRDIIQSSFSVAGPGTLEISAGRNIRMDDQASVTSLGPVLSGDRRAGASIAILAGAGSSGPDYAGLITRYLNPANLAQGGIPLAEQAGKVAKTYEKEMAAWLSERYGFIGSVEQAQAYFWALPAEQQRVFGRQIYFAELQAGGREFNDANSTRFGSYLRGRNVIAALFSNAASTAYRGDFTMYGSAGINTLFGGDIQLLTPGGHQMFGTEGAAPASVDGVIPGIITQGAGDIQMYAMGSILLGQSRVMTTFGGSILGWSASGDINAGRGSKTSVVFTPPKRVYDQWGNVTLSSDVPSTGAGIATLAPIPEVPAGDIDLIAPLGTIDAGEAGIRVSGNVNLAALQVVNAANIQVKGESSGLPVMAAVNVGALSNASAAASSASAAAQESVQRARNEARQALPSVVTVKVLGFGNETAPGSGAGSDSKPGNGSISQHGSGYDTASAFQVLGQGSLTPAQRARLTATEQRNLSK